MLEIYLYKYHEEKHKNCNQVGLEVSAETTKCEFMCYRQTAPQYDNMDLKIAKKSFENVAEIKYKGITLTSENFKSRLNSEMREFCDFIFPSPSTRKA